MTGGGSAVFFSETVGVDASSVLGTSGTGAGGTSLTTEGRTGADPAGSSFGTAVRDFSKRASTSARAIAYFRLEAVMTSSRRALAKEESIDSGSGTARLKSKSLRSTRQIAWPASRFLKSFASKYEKPSPSFFESSSPTRKTIRVYGWDTSGNTTESTHGYFTVGTPQYTITALAGSGGAATPNGNLTETSGANQSFTAIPNPGYAVKQWTLDGNVMQTGGLSYNLNNIQSNHLVQVTFVSLPPPIFNGLRISGNVLQMTLSGLSSGEVTVLELSTNMSSWTPVQTNTASGSTLIFTNTISPAKTNQFFRARLQ